MVGLVALGPPYFVILVSFNRLPDLAEMQHEPGKHRIASRRLPKMNTKETE